MREIKFRAWDRVRKKMYYLADEWELRYSNHRWHFCHIVFGTAFSETDNLNGDLMQFTGCIDKNKKEIYEGDIVRGGTRYQLDVHKTPIISQIIYAGNSFWVDAESFGWEGESMWLWEEMEVIGNIYENPELIKNDTPKLHP